MNDSIEVDACGSQELDHIRSFGFRMFLAPGHRLRGYVRRVAGCLYVPTYFYALTVKCVVCTYCREQRPETPPSDQRPTNYIAANIRKIEILSSDSVRMNGT